MDVKWGYQINEKRGINLDKTNLEFSDKLLEAVPSLRRCIGCGGCTATCSVNDIATFNLRRLHLFAVRGEFSSLGKEIRKCMLCGKCTLVCPRGVNTRGVILALNDMIQNNQML